MGKLGSVNAESQLLPRGAEDPLGSCVRRVERTLQLRGDARDLRVGAVVRLGAGGRARRAEWLPVLPDGSISFPLRNPGGFC